MLLRIIYVGKLKDKSIQSRCDEFVKWLRPFNKIELIELPDSTVKKEGEAILRALGSDSGFVTVLSEEGCNPTSRELANQLAQIDRRITFVIGGPFGLAPEVKARGNYLLSLSRLTFTHELARLLLFEQLFRVSNLQNGGHYHND